MDNVVLVGLAGSLLANAVFVYRLFLRRGALSTDARLLLGELARGKAIIKVEVLDTAGLFYRSPRG